MADDKRKKKRGRSKFFRSCFRSSGSDDGPCSVEKSGDRDTKKGGLGKPVLIAVSGRKGKDFIQDVNLVNGFVADNRGDCYAKRSSPPRKRITRILKAIWFDKKKKKMPKNSSKSSIASHTSLSPQSSQRIVKSSNDGNAYGRDCTDMDDACSRGSNLLSSSSRTTSSVYSTSSSSSTNSNSQSSSDSKTSSRVDVLDSKHPVSSNSSTLTKSNPNNDSSRSYLDQKVSSRTDPQHLRHQDSCKSLPSAKSKPINSVPRSSSSSYLKGLYRVDALDFRNSVSSNSPPSMKAEVDNIMFGGKNWNIRWCLFLLLSLIVLVLWGRIFSILCTSTWFYFVPCSRRIRRSDSVSSNMAEFLDTDSPHYKKRVIMAGLLERTRNPVR